MGGLGILLVSSTLAVRADETLILELPPSQAALDQRAEAKAKAEAQGARQRTLSASHAPRAPLSSEATASFSSEATPRGQYAARGKPTSTEHVVGRLGQLAQQTPIYRGPSSRTPRLTTAPVGTYLAIQDTAGDWYGVLMADSSIGWLSKRSVRLLDYQVVAAETSPRPPLPTAADEGDIYPRSSLPYFTGDPEPLLREAYKYLGVHYVWGGNTANGIDCSGFVKNVFRACGYPLPRLGSDQMAYGIPVPREQLQAGDRLYFGRRKDRLGVTHTGLYIGNGYFIHSSSSRHGVAVSHLSEPMFARIYVCARR